MSQGEHSTPKFSFLLEFLGCETFLNRGARIAKLKAVKNEQHWFGYLFAPEFSGIFSKRPGTAGLHA